MSAWVDLDGPVHYVDHGGAPDGPLLVCVHGLGGSLVNWAALAPLLTATCRVVALDLAGFGHTRAGSRSTGVQANRRLLQRFLEEVSGTPVILVGNSMGGLISILQAAESPEQRRRPGTASTPPSRSGRRRVPTRASPATFALFAVPAVGRTLLSLRRSRTTADEAALDLLRLCCADAIPRSRATWSSSTSTWRASVATIPTPTPS